MMTLVEEEFVGGSPCSVPSTLDDILDNVSIH